MAPLKKTTKKTETIVKVKKNVKRQRSISPNDINESRTLANKKSKHIEPQSNQKYTIYKRRKSVGDTPEPVRFVDPVDQKNYEEELKISISDFKRSKSLQFDITDQFSRMSHNSELKAGTDAIETMFNLKLGDRVFVKYPKLINYRPAIITEISINLRDVMFKCSFEDDSLGVSKDGFYTAYQIIPDNS